METLSPVLRAAPWLFTGGTQESISAAERLSSLSSPKSTTAAEAVRRWAPAGVARYGGHGKEPVTQGVGQRRRSTMASQDRPHKETP